MEYRLTPETTRLPRTTAFCIWAGVAFVALISGAYATAFTHIPLLITAPVAGAALTAWRIRRTRRDTAEARRVSIRIDGAQLVFHDRLDREHALPRAHVSRITRDEMGIVRLYTNGQKPMFVFEERGFADGSSLLRELEAWQQVEEVPAKGIWVPDTSILGGLLAIVMAIAFLARDRVTAILGISALVMIAVVAVIAAQRQRLFPRR
jgi:hypothetical protein